MCKVTEVQQAAVGQPGLGPDHVVHHVAVSNGPTAAGVVACHAAQRGLCAGGHIDRVPQAVRFEGCVQVVQHDARFHLGCALLRINVQHLAHMLAMVNDQASPYRLAALTGAATSRHDGYFQVAANVERSFDVVATAGDKSADGDLLINRGVSRVAAPVRQREQHFALGFVFESLRESPRHFVADVGDLFIARNSMSGKGGVHASLPRAA